MGAGVLNVWETMFIKIPWGVEREGVDQSTGWFDGAVDVDDEEEAKVVEWRI